MGEVEITYVRAQAEARVTYALYMVATYWEKKLETAKAEAVQDFHSSNYFLVFKLEFAVESYLESVVNYRAKF